MFFGDHRRCAGLLAAGFILAIGLQDAGQDRAGLFFIAGFDEGNCLLKFGHVNLPSASAESIQHRALSDQAVQAIFADMRCRLVPAHG